MVDEQLLEDATRLLGEKTYSATIQTALREAIRMKKVRGLREHFGQGLWEGNLQESRTEQPVGQKANNSQ